MREQMNIQDTVLDECIRKAIPVTMFLMNGFQLRGLLKGRDNFVVVLEVDGKQQMIYKHAISTISPIKPVTALNNL